jgi:hypothetical protein
MSHKINRIRSVPPTPGTDAEAAFAVHFDDGPEPQMVVEYAASGGGRHASSSHSRQAVRPYLDDENPPRRLAVDREGNVRPHD